MSKVRKAMSGSEMLIDLRSTLKARAEGRNEGGDLETMRTIDDIVRREGCCLYVVYVDEIPDLTTAPHEIADSISAQEVVVMWRELKRQLVEARKNIKELESNADADD